jgi:membrane protein implicated in regulation of membrane protease activity
VLSVYLAALVVALGVFAVQLFGGHHDFGGGHDVSHDGGDQGGEHEASAWSLLASTRFWCFAFLAFGLVGSLLTAFALAGATTTLVVAISSGLISGFFAASVIRSLTAKPATSHVSARDVVGKVGRVMVPLVPGGFGKVRVELKGGVVDYVARSSESVEAGETVVVEEDSADGELVVSRVPKDLAP